MNKIFFNMCTFLAKWDEYAKGIPWIVAKSNWMLLTVKLVMTLVGGIFSVIVLNSISVARTIPKVIKRDPYEEWKRAGYSGEERRKRTLKNLKERQKFQLTKKLKEYVNGK